MVTNIAKNGRVKSSMSPEAGRTPVGQCIFQGLNESGGVASGPLRMGGMEAERWGSHFWQVVCPWEANPMEWTRKQLAI